MPNDTPTHCSWRAMRDRCKNPNAQKYHRYGGRGIRICDRWDLYDNFLMDMGLRPPLMTLDRIDVDGHYEPSNCRWTDAKTQAREKNKYIGVTCVDCKERPAIRNGMCHRCSVYLEEAGIHRPLTARRGRPRGWRKHKDQKSVIKARAIGVLE